MPLGGSGVDGDTSLRLLLEAIEEPAQRLKKFDAVTLDDVLRVAKQYLRFDKMSLAAIGPFKDEDELRALLPLT